MELFSTCHGATNCQCFPADRWQRVGALENDEIYCSSGRKSFTTTKPGRNQQVHVWPRPLNSLVIFLLSVNVFSMMMRSHVALVLQWHEYFSLLTSVPVN